MIQMDEKTETYLLTNKGIEKLDASKELSQRDMKSLNNISDKDKKDEHKNESKAYRDNNSQYGGGSKSNARAMQGVDVFVFFG